MDANQFQQLLHVVGGNSKKPPELTEVTPGAWRVWRRQFGIVATHRQWNDERQKLEAATAMKGDAAKVTNDLAYDNAEQTAEAYLLAMQQR